MGASTQNLPVLWFLAAIAVRTAIVFFLVIVGILLTGKRQVGNLNTFDVAMILLIGNAIQNSITTGSGELGAGLISAGVLLAAGRLIDFWFARRPEAEKVMLGDPTILVLNGEIDRRKCRQEGVDEDEIRAAARDIGITDLADVRLATLENDGAISIVPAENKKKKAGG